jgi:membrane-bound ClpP family serine protease
LSKKNFLLILIGLGIMVLGYVLLSGGGSDDPNVFNYDMFSFRRLVVAPVVILAGFGFEMYAIMKKPKKQ